MNQRVHKTGKSKRFHKWIAFRKLKNELKRRYIDPNGMFKCISDYGYGDDSESEPMSLKDAFKHHFELNHYGREIEYDISELCSDHIHYIKPCRYGWY